MPRKEKTNAKTWERDRRNRMNTYFKTLSDLLPPQQEGRKRNKVDILIHASKYIKELNNRTDELFNAHAAEAHKEELSRLKKLVTQLFSRTQLLSALLQDAGITVPAEPALEKISPLKWSNKINVEESEKYVDRLTERKKPEKRKNKQTGYKVPSKQKIISLVNDSPKKVPDPKKTFELGLIEDQENHVNSSVNENCETRDAGAGASNETANCSAGRNGAAAAHNDVVPPLEATVPKAGKRIRKLESRKKVKRKGKIIDPKSKKKKIHATPSQSQSIGNLLPGTLIWSAGKIVPLVTPITSLTPNILVGAQAQSSNPIILGNAQQNQMIVMQSLTNRVQSSVLPVRSETLMKAVQKVALNAVSGVQTSLGINSRDWSMKNIIEATKSTGRKVILPKGKEITTTTMTYKVPIPAIHREPPLAKLTDNTDNHSRKSKKIVKSRKAQKRENLDSEISETRQKNETPIDGASIQRETTESPKKSSPVTTEHSEINEKKRKATEDASSLESHQAKIPKITNSSENYQSIDNIKTDCEKKVNTDKTIEKTKENEKDHFSRDLEKVQSSLNKSPVNREIPKPPDLEIENISQPGNSTMNDKNAEHTESCSTNSEDPVILCAPCDTKIPVEWSVKSDDKMTKEPEDLNSIAEGGKSSKNCDDIENGGTTGFPTIDETSIVRADAVVPDKEKEECDLGSRFDNLLRATANAETKIDDNNIVESTKIILNLDTNTTTTMKPEVCGTSIGALSTTVSTTVLTNTEGEIVEDTRMNDNRGKEETLKSLSYNSVNSFVPIGNNRADGLHSDLSNDLFASLQVPSSSHNPESISPTAAFLMAFPLVSSLNGKTEVLEEEMKEDLKYHSQTPPMLLQIGAIEPNSFKVKNDSPPASTVAIDKANIQGPINTKITTRASEAPKALPKIVSNETLKEPLYKVVQYPEPSLVTTENFVSLPSTARPSDSTNTTNAEIQATTIDQDSRVATNPMLTDSTLATTAQGSTEKSEHSARKCDDQTENIPLGSKYEETNSSRTIVSSNCTSDSLKYDFNGRYPMIPDYVPGYTNFINSSQQQPRSNYGTSKPAMVNTSEIATTIANLDSTMSYPSMMRSQAVQSAYVAHTTGKEVVQSPYTNRRKDPSVNSTESITSYIAFPSVSQSFQHDYLPRNKESYQSYDIYGKDNNAVFQGYPMGTTKNSTTHETVTSQQDRSYVASRINEDVNVKETLNVFQSYPTVSQSTKETASQRGNTENSSRLNSREATQRVEASTRSNNGKIDNFLQTTSYSNFPKDPKSSSLVGDTMFHQTKRNETQNYVPYSRDTKKVIYDNSASSSLAQTTKSQIITNSTIPRYGSNQLDPEQQQTCAATSNYVQSTTVSDNSMKSTTTVAHNSSNFSILSWTTFSPIGGGSANNANVSNNNGNPGHVHYEAGSDNVEQAEPKTSCENYTYTPVHKESYGNMLPTEGFSTESSIVDKSRDKLINDSMKPQIFEDSSKPKAAQAIVTEHKIVRSHNQTVNATADYKYVGETKSKLNKYPIGSTYTQTEFSSLEQQQSAKGAQTVSGKSEKTTYPMPTYDSQATFDIPETNVAIKCNSEIYNSSNYKYIDEKDTNLQLKYQPHAQSQSTILHHDAITYNGVKHINQQQQPSQQQQHQQQQQQSISNKSKIIEQQQQQQLQQQQQPVRPPVNWMMTPEIKHSTNIADLILPPIGKELEFCQNNIFTQPTSYNQSTSNHQFYNNYDATVSAPHGFPNISTLQTEPRRITDGFYSEEQPFSWSPTKNTQIEHNAMQKTIDQHVVVPSTLPTLVGDLALGTNISEKQSFLFAQMAPRNKDIVQPSLVNKDKDNVVRDYQTMINTQNSQQTVQSTSFLSVSQLVEHEKAEKSNQQQNHHSHNHNHHHHHNQHQQQQQQHQQQSSHPTNQPQTRKHQRKNANTSPRTTAKRQIESRKTSATTSVVDQLHSQTTTEEQKISTSHTFAEQTYHHHHQQQQQQQHQQSQQTQKFQQNDVHWRNRQCKSNYTAEALIGGNTNVHDNDNPDKQMQASTIKSFTSEYPHNKYPTGIGTTEMIMPTINHLSNTTDDPNSYGQNVNQNFNPSSYAYSPNTNIYPTTNFITSISNTPTSYMMPLHDNPSDFIETNSFLLPNVTSSPKTTLNVSSTTVSTVTSTRLVTSSSLSGPANSKSQQQHYSTSSLAKNQNCDKRNSYQTTGTKKSKRKTDSGSMHNLEFPISSVASQIDDYHSHPHHHHHHHHSHPSSFLTPPHANPLYQNHSHPSSVGLMTNPNRIPRATTLSNNPSLGHHHPSGTSLTNFNLSTIFPEINDKVPGYKPPNVIPPGLSQASNHPTATYPQRGNYAVNNTLGHIPQESTQFTTDLPTAPPPGVLHYKNT